MLRYLRKVVKEKLDPHSVADLKVMVNLIYKLTHDCRGGPERLARRLGYLSGQDIINEVNPHGESRAKPGFLDVVLWVRETQDFRLLNEVDEFVGRTNHLDLVQVDDGSIIENASKANKEAAEAMCEVAESFADGSISDNDLVRIEKEADEAILRWQAVKKQARELNGNEG